MLPIELSIVQLLYLDNYDRLNLKMIVFFDCQDNLQTLINFYLFK